MIIRDGFVTNSSSTNFMIISKEKLSSSYLYEKLGFKPLGVIPGGFLKKDGAYEDIVPYYHEL